MISRLSLIFGFLIAASVTLTWVDNSNNEDGFLIERAIGAAPFLPTFANVGPNVTTYADNNVIAGTAYSYRVLAFNTAGNSVPSNTATVTAGGPVVTLPTAPGTLTVTTTLEPKLINVSGRGQVGVGPAIHIAGFVVQNSPAKILLRGIGPGLSQFNVAGFLVDPKLEVFSGTTVINTNDNWTGADVAAASTAAGMTLAAGSKDAALIVTLAPGTYTVHLLGVNNTVGVALFDATIIP